MMYDPIYERINWENEEVSRKTALGAINLNKMDYALYEHDKRIVNMDSRLESQEQTLSTIEGIASASAKSASESAASASLSATTAKLEAERAKTYADNAEAVTGIEIATKERAGIIKGGDILIDEGGVLQFTATTTSRELTESQAGGIRIISMDGESQQKQYSGKNLLPNTGTTTKTQGITFTVNEDKSITVSGTATGSAYFTVGRMTPTPNVEYNFTSSVAWDTTTQCFIAGVDGNSAWLGPRKFTPTNDAEFYCQIYIASGKTVNLTFKPMVRLSSITDGTYEPYVGGIASPNPEYEQATNNVEVSEISSHGKNLYDEVANNVEINHSGIKFTKNEYGNLTLSGTTTASINAVMNPFTLPAGTYYYQKGTTKNVSVRLYNRTASAFIAYDNGSFTLAEESTLDVRVQSNSGSAISGTIKIQIEKGSMTEYEPYTATKETLSAPIVLRGIGDVKDTIVKKDGVYGVLRNIGKYVPSANDTYSLSGTTNFAWIGGSVVPIHPTNKDGFSSHFTMATSGQLTNAQVDYGFYYGNSINFRVKGLATVEEYKNFFTNNTVEFTFVNATPTFEPLPLADQIALHKLETFGGVTYLFTDSTIEPIIEVEYGTSKVGGYAIKGLNTADANTLMIEQLKTLTNELATQIVAGSEG